MPEGVQLGSMFWTLSLRHTVKQDADSAKAEIDGLERKTQTATKTTDKYSDSILKGQVNTLLFGTSAIAAGAAISTGATALSRLNVISSDTADTMRVAATGLDSIAAAALNWPQIKQFASILSGAVVPALQSVTAAAVTTRGALTALTMSTVIGALAVGGYLLYEQFQRVSSSANALEKQANALRLANEQLKVSQDAVTDELKAAGDRYSSLTSQVKEYDEAINRLNKGLERSKTIGEDLHDVNLQLEGSFLDIKEARNAVTRAAEKGDLAEIERAKFNLKMAQERDQDLKAKRESLQAEKEALPTAQELAATLAQRRMAAKQEADARRETVRLAKEQEKIEEQIKTNQLAYEMIQWQKEKIGITQEQRNLWSKVPWMKKALDMVPETVLREPDVLKSAYYVGASMRPGAAGMGLPLALESAQTKEIRNPFWGNTTAPAVDASIHVEKIEVKSADEIGQSINALSKSQRMRLDLARNGVSL